MWVRIKLKVKSLDSRAVVDVNSLGFYPSKMCDCYFRIGETS